MPAFRWVRSILLVFLILLISGCARHGGRCEVSGHLTFQGQPLDQGTIQFFTTSGPPGPAAGAVIQDGKYDIPPEQGLAPGTYRVSISSPEPAKVKDESMGAMSKLPGNKERIPAKYNSQSTLTIEVKSDGPNTFDFTID